MILHHHRRPPEQFTRDHKPVTLAGIMTAAFVCACLIGASGMLWFAVRPAFAPMAPLPDATPYVVVNVPPVPAELIAAAKADVARATETAPTPTNTPTPIVAPTARPWTFCIKGAVKPGEMCEWPQPPAPTPTPYPVCGTPRPGDQCIWREP